MDKYPRLIKSDNSVIIEINSSPFTLGRAWNCNHVMLAESMSRIHCSFEKDGNYWILKDTSTNGTYVNGMVIQSGKSRQLMDGDIINFDRRNENYIFHLVPRGSIWDEQQSRVAEHLPSQMDIYPNYATVTPYTTVPTYRANPTFRTDSAYRTEPAYRIAPTYRTDNEYTTVPEYITNPEYSNNTTAHPYSNVPEYATEPQYPTGDELTIVHERSVVPAYTTIPEYTTVPASPTDTASLEDSPSSVPTEVAGPSNIPQDYTTKMEMPKATSSSETENREGLQDEMQCSICSELFIKATTLNCSHTFCKFCIETWRKNKSDCPICRAIITSMNPTLVLDNVIEMVVQNGSEEVKQHRKEVLEDRQKCVKPSKHENGGPSTEEPNNPRVLEELDILGILEVSSEVSDNDGMNWSGRMAFTNPERSYTSSRYCYCCGTRGHWSRDCPSRERVRRRRIQQQISIRVQS